MGLIEEPWDGKFSGSVYRDPDKDGNPTLVATLPVGDFEKLILAWQREFELAKGKKDGEVWDMVVDFE